MPTDDDLVNELIIAELQLEGGSVPNTLVEDVQKNGIKVPIIVDETGKIHDGKQRVWAAVHAGLTTIPGLVLPAPQAAAVSAIIKLLGK